MNADPLPEKLDRFRQDGKRLERMEEPFVCRNHTRVETQDEGEYIESYTERDVMSAIACASFASARHGVVSTAIFSISRTSSSLSARVNWPRRTFFPIAFAISAKRRSGASSRSSDVSNREAASLPVSGTNHLMTRRPLERWALPCFQAHRLQGSRISVIL